MKETRCSEVHGNEKRHCIMFYSYKLHDCDRGCHRILSRIVHRIMLRLPVDNPPYFPAAVIKLAAGKDKSSFLNTYHLTLFLQMNFD